MTTNNSRGLDIRPWKAETGTPEHLKFATQQPQILLHIIFANILDSQKIRLSYDSGMSAEIL